MLAVVFIASLLPPEHIQAPGSDKLHHFLSYAVLAWWCTLVFQKYRFNQGIILAIKLIIFSGVIELLQGLSGYRYAEWYDLLANSIGVISGLIMATYFTQNILLNFDTWCQRRF